LRVRLKSHCKRPGPVNVLRPQVPRRTGLVGVEKSVVLNHRNTVCWSEGSAPLPMQSPYSDTSPPEFPSEPLLEFAKIVYGRPVRADVTPVTRQFLKTCRKALPAECADAFASSGISGMS